MKGHGSRKAGLATIRDMLLNAKKKDQEKPHLYFFQSAANHIRTIPIQQTSRFDPEDIDTDLEDHCIAEGDFVLTRQGWRKVLVSQKTGENKDVLIIRTAECSIYCTGNHKIWTENRGFVRADSINEGDTLLWLKGKLNAVVAPVLSISKDSNKRDVYDLTIEDTHEFFVNGLLVHNCIDALRYLVARKNSVMKRGGVRM